MKHPLALSTIKICMETVQGSQCHNIIVEKRKGLE